MANIKSETVTSTVKVSLVVMLVLPKVAAPWITVSSRFKHVLAQARCDYVKRYCFPYKLSAGPACGKLFHGDALRQVPRLVHIGPFQNGNVIGQKLERYRQQQWIQILVQ